MAKFLKHSSGSIVEDTSTGTSAGAGDANKGLYDYQLDSH